MGPGGSVGAEIRQPAAPVAADFQHRVHDQVNGDLGPAEDDADGVHEKGRVIRDEHDQGVRGFESVPHRIGIEYANERLPGPAALRAELQMRNRRSGE